jgi:hypothetical protein
MVTKISVKDWRNLPTLRMVRHHFRQFLADQHEAKYAIKYTTRNFAIEARWLKSMVAEHGAEVVRHLSRHVSPITSQRGIIRG